MVLATMPIVAYRGGGLSSPPQTLHARSPGGWRICAKFSFVDAAEDAPWSPHSKMHVRIKVRNKNTGNVAR